jgi:hypothetical protein
LRIASKWPLTTRGNKAPARAFIPIALRGFIMEMEHTEGVIEKALAFVKHTLGVPPVDQTPDVVANPEYTDTAPEPTIEGAMRLDPRIRTLKIGAEINAERREDESANSAVGEHMQAAGKLHRAEWSVQKALGEIQDISRDMREKFVAEKNSSYKDEADIKSAAETMNDNKLPTESEMQEAVERARDANSQEKSRQAEQESDWR